MQVDEYVTKPTEKYVWPLSKRGSTVYTVAADLCIQYIKFRYLVFSCSESLSRICRILKKLKKLRIFVRLCFFKRNVSLDLIKT